MDHHDKSIAIFYVIASILALICVLYWINKGRD